MFPIKAIFFSWYLLGSGITEVTGENGLLVGASVHRPSFRDPLRRVERGYALHISQREHNILTRTDPISLFPLTILHFVCIYSILYSFQHYH
jgi:hypothetical protein